MQRLIEEKLIHWKNQPRRKPLLIEGIRQVGKTWILKYFGQTSFNHVLYLNFDMEPTLCHLFERTKDPDKIILELSILYETKIYTDDTLIIFDEIQSCNEALNSLKYFSESENNYYIIGAGSYLGIALSKGDSFPVGKVDLLTMYPMTYSEFLMANNQAQLADYIKGISTIDPIAEPLLMKAIDNLREYYMVGGMPEVVSQWVIDKDPAKLEQIQENILNAYYRDFSKYPPSQYIPKILGIWNSIVPQLSKENKKFKYSEISKGARAREYESALDWLIAGHYVEPLLKLSKAELPLPAYIESSHFKLYFPDTGLLRQKAYLPIGTFSTTNDGLIIPFKGAMAENLVQQELHQLFGRQLYYYTFNSYEIDFILQVDDKLYPIEVKFGENIHSKSLTKYLELNPKSIGIRYSLRNFAFDGRILNIPFPWIGATKEILKILDHYIQI